ncbi:MAG: hypothetical protein II857_02570 [Selenomonadaceae bacterium]|nr:hypothetical protein [Selenomonadaceae bacterium]
MNEYLRLNQIYLGSCMKFEDATRERLKDKKCLEYYGFKVYSQNDEDGIIEEIFNRVGTTNKIFIEFGVENGLECNSHYLLFKGWRGLWIDGGETHVKEIRERFAPVIANGQLKALRAFITRENINELFVEGGIEGEIDLLSIDIDGNDYYVWEAINVVKPRVVIVEYNAKFPPNCDWKQAYNKSHIWNGSDWHGASLKAYELLGKRLGYQLVGTNLTGSNAFFVREDLSKDLFIEPATAENLYNPARYHLRYTNGHPARYCLAVQHENFGLLDYKPNCDAIPLSGFYNEMRNGDLKFQVMAGKRAKILVRNKEKVALPYFLPNDAENLSLTVTSEVMGVATIPVKKNGLIEMTFPPAEEPWEVELELSRTFTDAQGKEFGLAIIFEVR